MPAIKPGALYGPAGGRVGAFLGPNLREAALDERADDLKNLQEEFNDVFDFFSYFIQIDEEVYLANHVEVRESSPTSVVLWDAWIWDERRPHRFVSRAELMTRGNVRVERLAHADDLHEAQEGHRATGRTALGRRWDRRPAP